TNATLRYFIRQELNNSDAKEDEVNNKIIEMIAEREELIVDYDGGKKITMYSQGKINGFYATSFEESIVLTNAIDDEEKRYKPSLIKILQYVHPKMRYFEDIDESSEIAEKSYMYQIELSDGKSKFSTGLVYLSVTDDEFSLKLPQYIKSGLESLCNYFEE
ncbi:TPA: ATP-dependent endonuclease, partial [Streptococcus suis]